MDTDDLPSFIPIQFEGKTYLCYDIPDMHVVNGPGGPFPMAQTCIDLDTGEIKLVTFGPGAKVAKNALAALQAMYQMEPWQS